jgi:hypothetical protein
MKDDLADQRQLELATSRHLRPDTPLDPKAAELREGWLLLTESLERCQAENDSAFAARVGSKLAAASLVVRGNRSRYVAVIGALGAVAAAALVVLAVSIPGGSRPRTEFASAGQAHGVVTNEADFEFPDDDAAWDDPLDVQIALVEEQVASLADAVPRLDASLSALDQQLAELANDLDGGSL